MSDGDGGTGPEDDSGAIRAIRTVASGGALRFGGKFVNLFLGLVAQIVMARLLLKSSYGNVTLAIAILGVSRQIGILGIDSGVSHLFPTHEDDTARARGVVRAAYRLSAVSGVVIAGGLFLSAPVLANRVFDDPGLLSVIRVIAVALPLVVLGEVAVSLARAARDVRPVVYLQNVLQPVVRVVMISALVLAGFEAVGAVSGHVLAAALVSVVLMVYVSRILPDWDAGPRSMDRELLVYSIPLLFANSVSVLMNHIDTFFVGYYLASESVGTYNVAYQLGTLVVFFLTGGAYILPPMLAKLSADGQHSDMNALYRTVTKWIVFASTPVALVLIVFPETFIRLFFGARYLDGTNVLQVLVLGTYLGIVLGAASGSLSSLGNNKLVLYTVAFAAVVNALLNMYLIPRFGLIGAGFATAISTSLNTLLNAVLLFRIYGLLPVGRSGVVTIGASVLAALLLYAGAAFTGLPLFVTGLLWIPAYLVLILKFGINERDEKILTMVARRLGFGSLVE